MKSVYELQCHFVNVRANCASIIFNTTSSRCMCCSKAFVSTPDGRGHSWPPSAVEKVYREFAGDHGTCHAFLYACTQNFCRPSNSLCDYLMRAAKNQKAPIPFCAKSSAESFGVSGWLLIRSRATLSFSRTTSLVALISPFPVPQWPRYRHASLMSSVIVGALVTWAIYTHGQLLLWSSLIITGVVPGYK